MQDILLTQPSRAERRVARADLRRGRAARSRRSEHDRTGVLTESLEGADDVRTGQANASMIGRNFIRVSASSLSGSESATIPAPA